MPYWSSLPSPEYEHIDKHERKAALMRQHATDTACTLVINWLYLATNQLEHCSHSYTTGIIAGVNGQNSEGMCQGGKPGTGKLYTDVCLCCSA